MGIGAHRAHSRLPATGVEGAAFAERVREVSQLGQGRGHVVHDPGKGDELETGTKPVVGVLYPTEVVQKP